MSATITSTHALSQAVALGRLQASRRDDHVLQAREGESMTMDTEFSDTRPLWFRSEAFAEDVTDHEVVASCQGTASHNGNSRSTDSQVLAAGATVLRQTLQALKLRLW